MQHGTRASDRYAVIMAGGRGERFWPLSREKTPKQLLKLLGDRSFLQQAVERVLPLVPAGNVFVITNEAQAGEVRVQLPELPAENVVAEPMGRDTCAAVTLGAALVGARSAAGIMAVLPADHVIPDRAGFQRVLGDAFEMAGAGNTMVTIGIEPTEPATGYGYIRLGERLLGPGGGEVATRDEGATRGEVATRDEGATRDEDATGDEGATGNEAAAGGVARLDADGAYDTVFHRVERFVEKPPLAAAAEYLASGRYRWNAGMFVWSFETIGRGLREHCPEMFAACERWVAAARGGEALGARLARDYPELRKISVDYALMEHARNVVVADGTFAWDDLGSWTALARHLPRDADGNCAVGDIVYVDGAGNLIYDARTRGRTPIALVGVRDMIVVQTDDAVLVAAKSEVQKVKDLVQRLAQDDAFRKLV